MKIKLFAAAMALCMILTGCGGGAAASDLAAGMTMESAPSMAPSPELPKEMMDMSTTVAGDSADYYEYATNGSVGSQIYNDPNAKLIREATVEIQTTEFDTSVEQLSQLVNKLGGYFQNVSLQGGSYRNVNANRTGEYTVRVPAQQYDMFMNQAGGLGYVTYRNESTMNIGEQYYDTEARLKTQKAKQERLLALMEEAETMEDIITIESALSDVEYQIEQLSSTLNRYDSLVGFSTIQVWLHEVHKVTEETGVTNTLGQRMKQGFTSGMEDLVDGAQDFLVWVSYNIFGIIILVVVILGGYKVSSRVVRRRKLKKQKNQNTEDN